MIADAEHDKSAANEYYFVTHWQVAGTVEEVADVLADHTGYVRWWSSVYLDVRVLEPGDARGVGRLVSLHTKGWLPYTLRWRFRVTESRHPFGYTLEAFDDLNGRGVWTFAQKGRLSTSLTIGGCAPTSL